MDCMSEQWGKQESIWIHWYMAEQGQSVKAMAALTHKLFPHQHTCAQAVAVKHAHKKWLSHTRTSSGCHRQLRKVQQLHLIRSHRSIDTPALAS